MKITCNKTLEIKKGEAILHLESLNERLDIQDFLKKIARGKIDLSKSPHKEIALNLLDRNLLEENNNTLTKIGEEVKTDGLVWEEEKGRYEIKFIEDEFINKIIEIERKDAFSTRKSYNHDLTLSKFEDKFYDTKKNNEKTSYRLLEKKSKPIELLNSDGKLKLKWVLENEQEDFYSIVHNGQKKTIVSGAKKVNINDIANEICEINGYKWNEHLYQMEIDFDEAKNIGKCLERFQINSKAFDSEGLSYTEFDKISISRLPVMPKTETCAGKWARYLLDKKLENEHLAIGEYETLCQEITSFDQIDYHDFSFPGIEAYIQEKQKSILTSSSSKLLWNLSTSSDLNPFSEQTETLIAHKSGDRCTINDIVDRIKGNKKIKQVLYFDQHVLTDSSKEKKYLKFKYKFFEEFIKSFDTDLDVSLYTKVQHTANICEQISNIEILPYQSKDSHSRVLVLIDNDNRIDTYKIDRTIDVMTFKGDKNSLDFDNKSEGITKNFSIFKISEDALEDYIKEEIARRVK